MHNFADRTEGEMDQRAGMKESLTYLHGLVEDERALLEEQERGSENWDEMGKGKGKLILAGFSQGCAMGILGLLSGELKVDGFVGMSGWLPFRRQVDEILANNNKKTTKGNEVDVENLSQWAKLGTCGLIWNYVLRFLKRVSWVLSWVFKRFMAKKKEGKSDEEQKVGSSGEEQEQEMERKRSDVVQYYREALLHLPIRPVRLDPTMPILLGHGTADEKMKFEWGVQMRDSLMNMGMNVNWKRYEGLAHEFCEEELRDFVAFLRNHCKED